MDFGLPWFRLPSGLALMRPLCGRSSTPLFMTPAYRNLLLFKTPMTFGLLNSLSSSKLHLLLFLGHISYRNSSSQRRVIGSLLFLSAHTFHYRIVGPGGSLTFSDVPGEMTADVFAGRIITYLQFGFFDVSPNPCRFLVY
jgi:hypothetical protein